MIMFLFSFQGSCRDQYTSTSNTDGVGGDLQSGVNTDAGCRQRCSVNSRVCYGYDFNVNGRRCRLYYVQGFQIGNSGGATGSTLYRRITYTCVSGQYTSNDRPKECYWYTFMSINRLLQEILNLSPPCQELYPPPS